MRLSSILILLSGCGYTVAQAERAPKGITKIYVNQAMDNSTEVGPAATLTRALRHRVDVSHAVRLVPLSEAEAVFEARIEAARDGQSAVSDGSQAATARYSHIMTGTARLIDNTGTVIWQSGPIVVATDYAAGMPVCTPLPCAPSIIENNISMTESNRRRALERAAEQLADALYTRLVEQF